MPWFIFIRLPFRTPPPPFAHFPVLQIAGGGSFAALFHHTITAMHRLVRILVVLLFPLTALAQPQIWQVPAVAHDVDLREDTSYVVASITIDAPDTGRVIVRFDGWASSTPGDRIILGASSYPDWNTNDGNMALYVFDSLYTVNSFSHSRVYDIEPGTQTFYAVAQNYVDRDGSGFASIDGKLTVEYIPNILADLRVAHQGILTETYWDQNVLQVIDSVIIDVPADGEVIVQYDGTAAMYYGGVENHYTISDSRQWPSGEAYAVARTTDIRGDINYVLRKTYPVSAGAHVFYALGRREVGDPTESDDYTYASLTARFVASGSSEVIFTHSAINGTVSASGAATLGEVTITTPAAGTISLQATANCASSADDLIRVRLVPSGNPDSVLDARAVRPLLPEDPNSYMSLSGLVYLPAGTHTFRLIGEQDDTLSTAFDDAVIRGLISAQFIADPVISATEKVLPPTSIACAPNPTSGVVRLTVAGPAGRGETKLFDDQGRLLRTTEVADVGAFEVDLRSLVPGVYTIRVSCEGRVGVTRIVRL